jgi:hypothetical protein
MASRTQKIIVGLGIGVVAAVGGVAIFNSSDNTPKTIAVQYYPIKDLLGIDGHEWDFMSHPQQTGAETRTANLQNAVISTGFTWIRLYADATVKKDATNSTFMFSPDGRGYTSDSAFFLLKKANPNIKINYCYQNAPKNIQGLWQALGKRSTAYRLPNTDVMNYATWSIGAHDFGVIAGRYGTNTNVPDYPLFVSPNWWEQKQQMLKGSWLADQIEFGNELDNQYSNVNATTNEMDYSKPAMTGTQYAATWKAPYDSAKKYDPNISVSTTGVMTEDPQVLKDAIAWSKSNNSGVIPFDVYQFHCYPWGWAYNIASALPPEYNMVPAAKKVVAVSEGKKVAIGEWGYDLHPESNMGIRPFAGYTGEQIRSYWIARSLLGFAASGIGQAFYYREYQDYGLTNDNNSTIFETSSLFIKDDNDNITRRLSGDVFKQLTQWGDFVYDSTLVDDSIKVVYRFKSGTKKFLAAWTKEKFKLVLVNGTNRAELT